MKYKAIKTVPAGTYLEECEEIPAGTICETQDFDRIPAICYKGRAVCDPESKMQEEFSHRRRKNGN